MRFFIETSSGDINNLPDNVFLCKETGENHWKYAQLMINIDTLQDLLNLGRCEIYTEVKRDARTDEEYTDHPTIIICDE